MIHLQRFFLSRVRLSSYLIFVDDKENTSQKNQLHTVICVHITYVTIHITFFILIYKAISAERIRVQTCYFINKIYSKYTSVKNSKWNNGCENFRAPVRATNSVYKIYYFLLECHHMGEYKSTRT